MGDRPQEQADRGASKKSSSRFTSSRGSARCARRDHGVRGRAVSRGVRRQGLGEKRINNILAVLSKPLKYAVDCELIAKAPKIGMFKVERPEIVAWDFEQYARLLAAAKAEGEEWYAAVCLAGEAGLRVGEVKALRWREDVDMIARTITVNQQTCNEQTDDAQRPHAAHGADDGDAARRAQADVRHPRRARGAEPRRHARRPTTQAVKAIGRICRRAGLPVRLWHTLRHYAASRIMPTRRLLSGTSPSVVRDRVSA